MNYLKKLFCSKLLEENQKLKEAHRLASDVIKEDDKLINSLRAEIETLKDTQEEEIESLENDKEQLRVINQLKNSVIEENQSNTKKLQNELEEYKKLQAIYPLQRHKNLFEYEGVEVEFTAIYRGEFENGMKVFKSITDDEFRVCESILIRPEHITLECDEYDIVTLTGTVVKFKKRIRDGFVDDWTLENATAVAKKY